MEYRTLPETRHSSVDLRPVVRMDGWAVQPPAGYQSVATAGTSETLSPLSTASVWESGDHFHYLANRSWQPPPLSVLVRDS